jgi:hypothetical protein
VRVGYRGHGLRKITLRPNPLGRTGLPSAVVYDTWMMQMAPSEEQADSGGAFESGGQQEQIP